MIGIECYILKRDTSIFSLIMNTYIRNPNIIQKSYFLENMIYMYMRPLE